MECGHGTWYVQWCVSCNVWNWDWRRVVVNEEVMTCMLHNWTNELTSSSISSSSSVSSPSFFLRFLVLLVNDVGLLEIGSIGLTGVIALRSNGLVLCWSIITYNTTHHTSHMTWDNHTHGIGHNHTHGIRHKHAYGIGHNDSPGRVGERKVCSIHDMFLTASYNIPICRVAIWFLTKCCTRFKRWNNNGSVIIAKETRVRYDCSKLCNKALKFWVYWAAVGPGDSLD